MQLAVEIMDAEGDQGCLAQFVAALTKRHRKVLYRVCKY